MSPKVEEAALGALLTQTAAWLEQHAAASYDDAFAHDGPLAAAGFTRATECWRAARLLRRLLAEGT